MNPPWATLWSQINAAFAGDALVSVNPPDDSANPFVIVLTVNDYTKAVAIASLLKARHDFGNVSVVVKVCNRQGSQIGGVSPNSADELSLIVRVAFNGNLLLTDVVVRDLMGRQRVFPVIAKTVIQFYNDDLSELNGNYNAVAAAVLSEICEVEPGGFSLNWSTAV